MTQLRSRTSAQIARDLNLRSGDTVSLVELDRNPRHFRVTAIGDEIVLGREITHSLRGSSEQALSLTEGLSGVHWVKKL